MLKYRKQKKNQVYFLDNIHRLLLNKDNCSVSDQYNRSDQAQTDLDRSSPDTDTNGVK